MAKENDTLKKFDLTDGYLNRSRKVKYFFLSFPVLFS